MTAGRSRGSGQKVFEIPIDTWFKLRTGTLTTLISLTLMLASLDPKASTQVYMHMAE